MDGTTVINGATYTIYNAPTGNNALNTSLNYEDFKFSANYHGQSTIKYFAHSAHSIIGLHSSIYSTAAIALSHVTYSGSDAVIHLTGTDTITILGAGVNSLVASDFNIYNAAPVVGTVIGTQNAIAGNAFSYTTPASAFSDIDSPTVTYSAKLGDGTALPSWLAFDSATHTFSGTPPSEVATNLSVAVTFSDGSLAASKTFALNVASNVINGTSSNDTLTGTTHNDAIYGLDGNDTITGGLGADKLTGGLGNDVFHYDNLLDSTGSAHDTITDFTVGQDKIDIVALGLSGIHLFTDLTITQDAAHNETIITANDIAHPGATEHFELHLQGIITMHDTDFMFG